MLNKTGNIQTFLGMGAAYQDANIVLFGAPYDGTTSNRPGTRFGPAAMRGESHCGMEAYSPYLDKDLNNNSRVYDAGELDLPRGCPQSALEIIENAVTEIIKDEKMPLMTGGEHLVTLGAIRAISKKIPDLHIIHLDAHADLCDNFFGETLSHATVMRRCYDILGDGRIFQFGIRSGRKAEFDWAKGRVFQQKFHISELSEIAKKLHNVPVYFSLDLDVLDPAVFPGTGTPEAGGISFMDLHAGLLCLQGMNVIGCDIVELAPNLDISGVSTATACKVLRELILICK